MAVLLISTPYILVKGTSFPGRPRLMLWAWERPERFTDLLRGRAGIAYLDQTVLLLDEPKSHYRQQPLVYPTGTYLIAVVRIESDPRQPYPADDSYVEQISDSILTSLHRSGAHALQIDFDARESERGFYRTLLQAVRRKMPTSMPLSMTALASWCQSDHWMEGLPVDEAVPMFFRMGNGENGSQSKAASRGLLEKDHCETTVGVATDEPWPKEWKGRTVYVFHPRGWNPRDLQSVMDKVGR